MVRATDPLRRGSGAPTPVATQRAAANAVLPKLTVSKPNDPLELEADRIADQVMRMPAPTPVSGAPSPVRDAMVQRKCAAREEDDLQRKADRAGAPAVGPGFRAGLAAARASGGQPLSPIVRAYMEPRFGRDFGDVRVHTDARASQLAESIHARAFTLGRDVFLKRGETPAESAGMRLLAHELAHVVQGNFSTLHRKEHEMTYVEEVARDIVAGRVMNSEQLSYRLADLGAASLKALLVEVERLASQRDRSDPHVDPLIEAAREEIDDRLRQDQETESSGATLSPLSPPGDCTLDEHKHLQSLVNKACKGPTRACVPSDDCSQLVEKIDRTAKCIRARTTVNARCFRGGDAAHQNTIGQDVRSSMRCWELYNAKCTSADVPPVVRTAKQADEAFVRRMAELTGLSGAALMTYLIVSEGTRLFPPRNLIPIP